MLKMILNGKTNEPIDLNGYSRNLAVENVDVRFNLSINFSGNFSAEGVEYLANYANADITSMEIEDASHNVLLSIDNANIKLTALNENCDENNHYGYANFVIYED